MDTPEIVGAALGDEAVAARVDLGGEDELLVTPTRTLVYRAEGLLSDESVDEYPHTAERVLVSEGRRKSKVTLDYGLDGERTFAVPTKRLEEALHPVLAGVLNAADITDSGETVTQTYRFSELTLVVTSDRLVKHIGGAVWDEEFEEYHYEDVTDLTFEEGSVATAVVLTLGGRRERFKAPNEKARAIREGLTEAVCAYHDVPSLDALRAMFASDDDEEEPSVELSFGDGPTPLSANPSELSEEPTNATRPDEESTAEADVAADASASAVEGRTDEASTATPEGADAGGGGEAQIGEDTGTDATFEGSGFESAEQATAGEDGSTVDTVDTGEPNAGSDSDVATEVAALEREVAALREAVEASNERLDRQEALISQLIEELRQGR